MTRSFGKVDSFRLKGQGLAKDISSLKGMYSWHSGGFSPGLLRGPFCSFLLCLPNIHKVFRRLCFSLNVCSFEGIFGPSDYLFSGSSAFDIFESGLWSLELSLSGQQRFRHIRVRALDPRIISFGPAALSTYSRQDFGPSGYPSRASSAFETSEVGPRSVELLLSAQ
jgi:hypothetical protein